MKLDRISYRRLFPTGAYANESIELSGTLELFEDPMQAYQQLHEMAKQLHLSKNAEIYEQMGIQERVIELVDKSVEENKIKAEYEEVEKKLNEFEFQEDAVAYLDTTTFKHYIPAKQIANSKPIKNK